MGLEYSRHNDNVVGLYAPHPYRASDHNPEIVSLEFGAAEPTSAAEPAGPRHPDRGDSHEHSGHGEPGRGVWDHANDRARTVLTDLCG